MVVLLNVKLNQKISEMEAQNLYLMPSGGDESIQLELVIITLPSWGGYKPLKISI